MKERTNKFEVVDFWDSMKLSVFISKLLSTNNPYLHWHYPVEILLVIEGPIKVFTESSEYLLNIGDLLIINSNELHCFQKIKAQGLALVIQVSPAFCKQYYPELKNLRFTDAAIRRSEEPGSPYQDTYREIEKLLITLSKRTIGYQFRALGCIHFIFYNFIVHSEYKEVDNDRIRAESKNARRMNRIVDYIHNHFMERITLSSLAEQENMDMYYLSRLITKYLGMSFRRYLNTVRIKKAQELFIQTELKSIDICMESGFSDYKQFSKLIFEEFGCTPGEYRKVSRDDEELKKQIDDEELIKQMKDKSVNEELYIKVGVQETFRIAFDYIKKNPSQ